MNRWTQQSPGVTPERLEYGADNLVQRRSRVNFQRGSAPKQRLDGFDEALRLGDFLRLPPVRIVRARGQPVDQHRCWRPKTPSMRFLETRLQGERYTQHSQPLSALRGDPQSAGKARRLDGRRSWRRMR
jgi:hypothetical protein